MVRPPITANIPTKIGKFTDSVPIVTARHVDTSGDAPIIELDLAAPIILVLTKFNNLPSGKFTIPANMNQMNARGLRSSISSA